MATNTAATKGAEDAQRTGNPSFVTLETVAAELQKLKEDYTVAISEAVFSDKRLNNQLEELKHMYNAQLYLLDTFGTKQKQINEQLHHHIVSPLQLENQQLKQQLFFEQSRLKLGIQTRDQLEASLRVELEANCRAQFEKMETDLYADVRAQFEKELEKRLAERLRFQNQDLEAARTKLAEQAEALKIMTEHRDKWKKLREADQAMCKRWEIAYTELMAMGKQDHSE